ncbi:MAG: flagellar basal body protein FliL [Gammaproteobacteria bacterium]|nr:flagellar basal body protein FliL [Gammaproteobacteria bacterium]
MADQPKSDDSDEASDDTKVKKDKSGMIKIALIALGIVAIIATNISITLMLIQKDPVGEEVSTKSTSGEHGDEHATAGEPQNGEPQLALYQKLEPTFVVNFQAEEALRFLQVTVELMARDEKVIAAVEQHMPIIRNNLIILFSSQDFTTISTRVGKERIRAQVLSEIQKILKEKTGQPGVEEVYFTSFVMQ